MHTTKLTLASLTIAGYLFSGCTNSAPDIGPRANDFVYHGHNFGSNRNSEYKQGVIDGCRTSDGDYTKNHALYQSDESYHVGWEHGRLHCKGTPAR